MYALRAVAVLFLILAVVVAYNPRARVQVVETWETVRPAVVEFMDRVYAVIRNIITGNSSQDRIDETPESIPGANFLRITTANNGFLI